MRHYSISMTLMVHQYVDNFRKVFQMLKILHFQYFFPSLKSKIKSYTIKTNNNNLTNHQINKDGIDVKSIFFHVFITSIGKGD